MTTSNVRPASMERITTPALAQKFIDEQIKELRAQIGDKKVLLALSGGVDSSVVAALLIKAVGRQLVSVHVNHGLLRKGEAEQVIRVFRDELIQVAEIGEGGAVVFLGIVRLADLDEALRHLLLQLAEQIINVLIVNIERAAVDVGNGRELPHGDILHIFLRHELHQRKPELPFGFSHAAVDGLFVHKTTSNFQIAVFLTLSISYSFFIFNILLLKKRKIFDSNPVKCAYMKRLLRFR